SADRCLLVMPSAAAKVLAQIPRACAVKSLHAVWKIMEVKQVDYSPPLTIAGVYHSRWAVRILEAAVELEVFNALANGPETSPQVARQLSVDRKGIQV